MSAQSSRSTLLPTVARSLALEMAHGITDLWHGRDMWSPFWIDRSTVVVQIGFASLLAAIQHCYLSHSFVIDSLTRVIEILDCLICTMRVEDYPIRHCARAFNADQN